MKRIWKREEAGGFTLIELIVVFAITAILAGVGTATYTAYIQRANKAADQQAVADLKYATQLANAADANLFADGNVGMIFLTDQGTVASIGTTSYNSDSTALTTALNDAIDLDGISLNYSGWGTSVSAAEAILTLASTGDDDSTTLSTLLNGGAVVSYASNASELWSNVVALCTYYVSNMSNYNDYTSGELLAAIAGSSVDLGGLVSTWNSTTEITSTNLSVPNDDKEGFTAALALRVARNNAFAEYLKGVEGVEASDITKIQGAVWAITNDVFNVINMGASQLDTDNIILKNAMNAYLLGDSCSYTDSSGNTQTCSQAYLDAMAYLTMMKAVDEVTNGEDAIYDPTSSTYLDDVGNYVLFGASVCSGLINLTDVSDMLSSVSGASTVVVITAVKTDDGLEFTVLPTEADVTDGQGVSSSDTDDEETVYTEYTVGYQAYKMGEKLSMTVSEGVSTSFTTSTPYKVTVEGGSTSSLSVSGSGDTWTWTSSFALATGVSGTFTLSLDEEASGISISGCTITAEQGASGTVTVTLTTTNDETISKTITFTSGN